MKIKEVPRQQLYELYIVKNLTMKEVAGIIGCDDSSVQRALKKHNIIKPHEDIMKRKTEKTRETNLKKYGCEYTFQSEQVKEKIKKTVIERYGVEYISKNKEIQKKKEQTTLKNYGVRHPSQNKEIQEKIKKTCIKLYGVDCVGKAPEVKEKYKKTCLEKYGCLNTFQLNEIKQKSKKTMKEKFGVEHSSRIKLSKKAKEVTENKQNFINFLESIPYERRTTKYCSEKLNCSYSLIKSYARKFGCYNLINHSKSTFEIKIREWIEANYPELKVEYNNKRLIKNPINKNCFELDVYIPERKLAIEFNGNYWHDDEWIQKSRQMSAKEYHETKQRACQEKGIKLVYIWERDIINKKYTLEDKLKIIFGETK